MNSNQFFNNLMTYVETNKIKNLKLSYENGLITIHALPTNYNTLIHFAGMIIALATSLRYHIVFLPCFLLALALLANLIIDFKAINKIKIDLFDRKLIVFRVHIGKPRLIFFKELLTFSESTSSQGDIYTRFRVRCNFNTEEILILFDVGQEKHALFFISQPNLLLKT